MFYPITLDKVRNFRFGMKSMSLIEKKLKKPITKIDMDSLSIEDMATLIWAGLVHEDKNLTPDKVMDLVDDYSDLGTVMKTLEEAFSGAFGAEGEQAEEKNGQGAAEKNSA